MPERVRTRVSDAINLQILKASERLGSLSRTGRFLIGLLLFILLAALTRMGVIPSRHQVHRF